MSYLEHNLAAVPVGFRKILALNWPILILLTAISGVGFVMLYSVAGGQIDRWAQPQMLRFFLGMIGLFVVAMVPIWFWRNMSFPAYCLAILLLIAVEFVGTTGMGGPKMDRSWLHAPATLRGDENCFGSGAGCLL